MGYLVGYPVGYPISHWISQWGVSWDMNNCISHSISHWMPHGICRGMPNGIPNGIANGISHGMGWDTCTQWDNPCDIHGMYEISDWIWDIQLNIPEINKNRKNAALTQICYSICWCLENLTASIGFCYSACHSQKTHEAATDCHSELYWINAVTWVTSHLTNQTNRNPNIPSSQTTLSTNSLFWVNSSMM